MQFAFDTAVLGSIDLEKALEDISAAGYTHIEIGLAHFRATDSTYEETRNLRRMLSDYNLEIAAVCGNYPLSHPDEEIRKLGVQQYKNAIATIESLECSLFVSELNGDIDRRKESEESFVKSVEEFLPCLEKSKVRLCFEAHPGDFIESNSQAVELIKRIGSKQLRYLYCAPHSFILGRNVSEMVECSKDVLEYVHFADSLRPEKTYFSGRYTPRVQPHQHLIPGLGDVNLEAVVDALRKIDYRGFITLNPFSHFDNPLEALNESKRKIQEFFGNDFQN